MAFVSSLPEPVGPLKVTIVLFHAFVTRLKNYGMPEFLRILCTCVRPRQPDIGLSTVLAVLRAQAQVAGPYNRRHVSKWPFAICAHKTACPAACFAIRVSPSASRYILDFEKASAVAQQVCLRGHTGFAGDAKGASSPLPFI